MKWKDADRQTRLNWLRDADSGGDGCCEVLLAGVLIAGAFVAAWAWAITLIAG